MIDFRYHLVSILAIFLALTVGLVLGATALQDSTLRGLRATSNSLHKDNNNLRDSNAQLKKQAAGEEQFAAGLAAQNVAARLKDQSVLFVQTPGGAEAIHSQLAKLIPLAGGHVTGEVTIQDKFLADDQQSTVDALTNQYVSQVPGSASGDVYARAGAVLASAIVTKDATRKDHEDTTSTGIVSAFESAGFITTSGRPASHATLAIVIAPSNPYQPKTADGDYKALISMTAALDDGNMGTVMAGPLTAAQDGGLINALRNSGTSDKVSSVDMADYSSGQTVTVLALQNEMGGNSGAYGIGPGVSGYLPSPVPSPMASPSAKGT